MSDWCHLKRAAYLPYLAEAHIAKHTCRYSCAY